MALGVGESPPRGAWGGLWEEGRGWRKRAPIPGGQLRVSIALCPGAVLWSREEQVQGMDRCGSFQQQPGNQHLMGNL